MTVSLLFVLRDAADFGSRAARARFAVVTACTNVGIFARLQRRTHPKQLA